MPEVASVPQMKKSYHSKTVPTDEAAMTIRVFASSSLRSALLATGPSPVCGNV